MPIAAVIKGTTYAVHSDHLNTPRKLTQANGQTAWQWAYSAFGDEQPTIAAKRFTSETTNPNTGATSTPEVTFNLRYPGQYFDKETKLHYNYYRSYDSRTGRYTQGDPIGLDGGWNRFSYVDGSPLIFTDPQGLFLTDALGGAGSYFRGIYRAGGHLYRRSGFDGGCEQQRAIEDEALLAAALYSPSDRRVAEPAFSRAKEWASNNKAYMAGRFGTGAVVGFGLGRVGPFGLAGGLSMGAMAAMGDALHGVANGADNPEQILRNIFGENAPGIPSNRPDRTVCSCRR